MIGRTFGRYRIVESLGEGGMGTVWKAEDDLLGRSVALKLLSARMADSDTARARLLREARAAGALDHPGIGTVYDAGEQDGEIFIAMRLVDGGTVADRIRSQGVLGLLDAVRIAADAADALGHAHARGILHRDVSARNLMLTKEDQVVVVDFGLAWAEGTSRLTQSGTTVGTACYMAPEIVVGQAPERQSDIYSLGAVLFEMLTGVPPFEGDRLQALLYAAVNTPCSRPSAKRPSIPPDLDCIVLKALSKKPEDRHESMESLWDELEAIAVSGVLPEGPSPPVIWLRERTRAPTASLDPDATDRLRLPARNRRRLIVAIAVVTLGLIVGGPYWLKTGESSLSSPHYSSLAVLPFKNTSENPAESEYLSEGLSQTLISKLTQLSGLRVLPWMTVNRFRDHAVPMKQLAKDLRVDALLLGTLRAEGRRICGTVSVVDGSSGVQLSVEDFDEPFSVLLEVQNRIATRAATKLLGRLSGRQAEVLAVPAAASTEAYDYYLKGSFTLRSETQASNEKALGLFRRSIEIDPRHAPAWVGVGTAHLDRYAFGWDGGLSNLATAEEAYGKALEYDPTSIPARRGLMRVHWYRGKSEECLKQGKLIAASSMSGSEAILARAEAYMAGGLTLRSLPLLRQVMAEDPANPAAPWLMVMASANARNFQEAVDAGQRFLGAFGEDSEVHLHMAEASVSMGQHDAAERHFRRGIEVQPDGRGGVQLGFAAFLRQDGRVDEADRLALDAIDVIEGKLQRSPDNCWLRNVLGAAYGFVGDLARMHDEEARVRHDCGDAVLGQSTGFASERLSGDKTRFVELARASFQAGNVGFCIGRLGPDLDPRVEDWPGYRELAAEQAVECKRLDALY